MCIQHILPLLLIGRDYLWRNSSGPENPCISHVLVPYQVELWSALTVGVFESLLETTLTAFQPPCFAFLHQLIPCDALNMNMISQPCRIPAWIRHRPLPETWFVALGLWQQSKVHSSVCLCTHTHTPILFCVFISVQQRVIWFCTLYGQTINT